MTSRRSVSRRSNKDEDIDKLKIIRRNKLIEYESEKHDMLLQCGSTSDPLYANFRFDETCYVLEKFNKVGLTLENLLQFQAKVTHAIFPWNLEYGSLRFGVNKRFDVFPMVIVMASTEIDVIITYKFACQYNIPISLRAGSHSFEGYSLCPGMVIDQSKRTGILLSKEGDRVKCEPGVLLGPLVDKLSQYKRTVPIGTCPNNGLTGYSLGGGLGSLTRFFGTASDNIRELKMLLADGSVITVNSLKNEDLFWAMRGAGIGNYGIVLSLSFKTHKIDMVTTFSIKYDLKHMIEILPLWFRWIRNDDISSEFRAWSDSFEISGISLVYSERQLKQYLEPLLDNYKHLKISRVRYVDSVRTSSGKGRWAPFYMFRNAFVDDMFDNDISRVLYEHMREAPEHCYVAIDNLGGVMNELLPTDTAFVHRGHLAWWHAGAQWYGANYENDDQNPYMSWLKKLYNEFKQYLTYDIYQNLPDSDVDDYLMRYYGENLRKLKKIKTKYDPNNVFNYKQSIPVN